MFDTWSQTEMVLISVSENIAGNSRNIKRFDYMAYVYEHYTKIPRPNYIGKPFYIGKGTGKRAWHIHGKDRNEYWHRVYKKYGLVVRIFKDNLTDEEAYELEKARIEEIGIKNLTNLYPGGVGAPSGDANPNAGGLTLEHKQKISEAMKCRVGTNHHFFGKTHREESKRKISQGLRNLPKRKWIHNGMGEERLIFLTEPLPEGFILGRNNKFSYLPCVSRDLLPDEF